MAEAALSIVTLEVHPDEPCYGARAGSAVVYVNGQPEEHWIERLWVLRGDAIARYERDCGSIDLWYKASPLIVIPAVEDMGEPLDETVGEVLEMLERHRHDDTHYRRLQEMRQASTLVADVNRQRRQLHEALNNRSVVGPYQKRQFDLYPSQFADRVLRDERAKRTRKTRFAT